ncbi:MAG: hypothetical protein WDW38_003798 [Sanguina aurantia]
MNKEETNRERIYQLVQHGEALLSRFRHWEPIIRPEMPGGTAYSISPSQPKYKFLADWDKLDPYKRGDWPTPVTQIGGISARQSAPDLVRVLETPNDVEEMELTSGGPPASPTYASHYSRYQWSPIIWKLVMRVLVGGPWLLVKGMSWVINKWQRLCWPINVAVFGLSDFLDTYMPSVHAVLLWIWKTISLALHFTDVLLIFLVMQILYDNGHQYYTTVMVVLYFLSHYLMAVTMYMEQDRVTGGAYSPSDLFSLIKRLLDVLSLDVQLLASVIHSNSMIEGMTQMNLAAYEESRVCLHAIINTFPACIILGVLYDALAIGSHIDEILILNTDLQQIYAAFALCVVNLIEKWIRFSLADPWLHPGSKDGYPLLYMRSNAARLPYALVADVIFRTNLQLGDTGGALHLKELFDKYTFNCKGDAKELCFGHQAYLMRKVMRTFNGLAVYNRAEIIARRLHRSKLKVTRSIRSLDASRLNPNHQMAVLMGGMLASTHGFDTLDLSANHLQDSHVEAIMEGLMGNRVLEIAHLDLAGNDMNREGAEAVATYLAKNQTLLTLSLSNNPIRDMAAKTLASALCENRTLQRLDLTGCYVGADGAAALGTALKANPTLKQLILCGCKLTPAGGEAIAKGLKHNTGLLELDMSKAGADDKTATALAVALSFNRTLTRISLAHTRVTDIGAKALCDVLPMNSVVQASITAPSAAPISRRELGVQGVSTSVGSSAAVVRVVNITGTPGYCHVDPNNELHGSVVTWGDTLIKNTEGECCDACHTTPGCNVWVYCGVGEGCGYGTNVRRMGECWLKSAADVQAALGQLGKGHKGIMWTAGLLYSEDQMAQWVASKAAAAAADAVRRKALEDDPRLPLVYLDVSLKGVPLGRIKMVLFADTSPLAAENLRALCTGEAGVAPEGHEGAGLPYQIKGAYFYRIIDRFIDQTGGKTDSVFGGSFRDDPEGLKLKHTHQGLLSMANSGPNTNGAHFSLIMGPAGHLDTHYTIFGEIVSGLNITDAVNKLSAGQLNNEILNSKEAQITDAGQLRRGTLQDTAAYKVTIANERLRIKFLREQTEAERVRMQALRDDPHTPLVFFDIGVQGVPVGRVTFALFPKTSPMAAENFRRLCTGERGVAPEGHEGAGLKYHFKGNHFYRIIEGFIDQTGTSTDSGFGGLFNDDVQGLALQHTHKGLLSMANIGPNTNGGHFSIMMGPAPHLNGHYTIFGEIIDGLWITELVNALAHGQPDNSWMNTKDAAILDSGQLSQGLVFDAKLHNITAVKAPMSAVV